MARITKKNLEAQVIVANKRAGWECYQLDHMAQGWRLMSFDGGTYFSPRLSTSLMYWWMDGFLTHTFIKKGDKQP